MVQNLKPVVELNSADWTERSKEYKLLDCDVIGSCTDGLVQNAASTGTGDLV